MIVVTVLVIIAFIWLYNDQSFDRSAGADRVGTIYGRGVTHGADLARGAEIRCSAARSDCIELWSTLIGMKPATSSEATENFVWNSLVLRHEADALGIQPTDDEVVAADARAAALPDQRRLRLEQIHQLHPKHARRRAGSLPSRLEDLVRDDLRLQKIKALARLDRRRRALGGARSMFERRSQKTEVSVVRLKLDDFREGRASHAGET